jgi:hypothetical protein
MLEGEKDCTISFIISVDSGVANLENSELKDFM